MYIRNLRKASPNKNVFKFASTKNGEAVLCESSLEFDACFHHEYNDSVKSFKSQPEGFRYMFNGKYLPYTPDMLLELHDRSYCFHEYKPFSRTQDFEFQQKFDAKRVAAQAIGIPLYLITDKQIRAQVTLDNLKLIHRYSGFYETTEIQKQLLQHIANSGGESSLSSLTRQLKLSTADARRIMLELMSQRRITTDIHSQTLMSDPLLSLCQ